MAQDQQKPLISPADWEHFHQGALELFAHESAWFERAGTHDLPFLLSAHAARLCGGGQDDPVRRQFLPDARELEYEPSELADPLGEANYSPLPRLVHRYPTRALLLATDQCPAHCRFCFRRHFTGTRQGPVGEAELAGVCGWLSAHPEVSELLISGGDPLTLPGERLGRLLAALRAVRPGLVLRVSSRVPVLDPGVMDDSLVDTLAAASPLWLVLHCNHPAELGPAARECLARLVDAGIPVVSQTVLLAGINDSAEVLSELFTTLLRLRLRPYYLFQLDLARGTAHFRVPLEKGLAIYRQLALSISPLALPRYAVDLPGGGGKYQLDPRLPLEDGGDSWILRDAEGKAWHYPKHGAEQ